MLESVDARTDRHPLKSHPISSAQAFGSGELKKDILFFSSYCPLHFSSYCPFQIWTMKTCNKDI